MPTNNPLPSGSLEDFKDNAIILDFFVNSQENEHPDRFARKRPTITGIIKEAFNVRTDISNMNETLIGQSRWDAVPKNTSLSLGGDNGALNKQAQALFNRTEMLKVHAREALRRTYQEVGLNLVPGSFEEGGTLNTVTDILIEDKTGKCYSWNGTFPKEIAANSQPNPKDENNWVPVLIKPLLEAITTPFPGGTLREHLSRDQAGSVYGELTLKARKRLSKIGSRVLLVGDSLSTIFNIDSVNFSSTFESNLRRAVKELNQTAKFFNRAIGGQRYYDLGKETPVLTELSDAYPWYSDITKRWMDYISETTPDVIFIAFGMNDGNGWDVGNFQQNIFLNMMEDLRSIPSRPEIVFCTNILPSTEHQQTESFAYQHGRDAMAGWTRSYAQSLGYSYIDIHRRFKMVRDGVDPCSMSYARKAIQRPVTLPWTYTDLKCDGYSARVTIDNPDTLISGIQFQLSSYLNNFISLRYKDSKWLVTGYTGTSSSNGISLSHMASGPMPVEGTQISFILNGNTVTILIGKNTDPIFSGQVLRFGGSFEPKIGGNGAVKVDLIVGTMLPFQASLIDSDIYSPGEIDGGNDINHPTAKASSILYTRPLDSVFNSSKNKSEQFDFDIDFTTGKVVIDSIKNPELSGNFRLNDVLTFIAGGLVFKRSSDNNVIGAIFGKQNRAYIDGAKLFNISAGCKEVYIEVDYYVPETQSYILTFGEHAVSDRIILQITDELRHRGTISSGGFSSDLISSNSFPFRPGKRAISCYSVNTETGVTSIKEPDGFKRGNIDKHDVKNITLACFSKLKLGYLGTSTWGEDVVISSIKVKIN